MSIFPAYIYEILDRLEKNGFEAYAVGGCVRDHLMGKTPYDYDITTNALPHQIKEVFSDHDIASYGEQHGTVGVIAERQVVEITTYRTEGSYTDHRRPDSVSFSASLDEDLKRRDFTINAVAMDKSGNIIDNYGGRDDIDNKILRTVGTPDERFSEDALRILRCLRFSSQLGFRPETETAFAMSKNKELLKEISAERIRSEFVKMLCGENAEEVLRSYYDIIEVFIPEIRPMIGFDQRTPFHKFDVWEHTIHAVGNGGNDPQLQTALLFHDIAKPSCMTLDQNGRGHFKMHPQLSAEMAEKIMKRLKFSSKDINLISKIIANHRIAYKTESDVKHMLNKIGEEAFFKLIMLKTADDSSKGYCDERSIASLVWAKETAERIIRENQCYRLKDLAVKGTDLMRIGYEGREVGTVLNELLELVIDGKLENKKDVLIKYAMNINK